MAPLVTALAAAVAATLAVANAALAATAEVPAQWRTGWGEDLREIHVNRRVKSVADTLPPRADPARVNETSFFLPMRDGVTLWSVDTVPDDIGVVGTVLERTPYGTATCAGTANSWNARGFAVVCQVCPPTHTPARPRADRTWI